MRRARLIRRFSRWQRIQPHVGRLHAAALRGARGRLRRSRVLAGGQPVMVLTTTGRRSGKRRSTTVAYVRTGDGYAAAALNLGSDRHPAWALNLRTDPRCQVCVGGERLEMCAREAAGAEAERLWQRFFEQLPMIEDSLSLARRRVPMFVLEPA